MGETMVETALALNKLGQVPIYAVTNGFFDDLSQGGSTLPGYRCPRAYEYMYNKLQQSGATWMRFYEFQWPQKGGNNCDMVLQTAAREASDGVPLVVHGFSNADIQFQLAAFLLAG